MTVPLSLTTTTARLTPLSPQWWTERLYKRLTARRGEIDFYDAYYRGDHPLPWLAPQARDEFRRILRMTRSNYMGLVVDATAERMKVEGFRLPADGGDFVVDSESWRIWQANNMDSNFGQGIKESLICGTAYLLVAPNPQDDGTPSIWVEHPSQAIVEYVPGTGRGARRGVEGVDDDWTGELHATLYLPGFIYKWKAPRPKAGMVSAPVWESRAVRGDVTRSEPARRGPAD